MVALAGRAVMISASAAAIPAEAVPADDRQTSWPRLVNGSFM
jgi:hypothetical protein